MIPADCCLSSFKKSDITISHPSVLYHVKYGTTCRVALTWPFSNALMVISVHYIDGQKCSSLRRLWQTGSRPPSAEGTEDEMTVHSNPHDGTKVLLTPKNLTYGLN